MAGARWRRAVSEVYPVADGDGQPLKPEEPEERQRKGRAEKEDKGGRGGSGQFASGKEGIFRRDLDGGGGGRRVTCGRVMWRDYK